MTFPSFVTAPKETMPCVVHVYHSPRPSYSDLHHVWPQALGGPTLHNLIPVCQTGHASIHRLLRAYEHLADKPPWDMLRFYGPGERFYAALGWAKIQGRL